MVRGMYQLAAGFRDVARGLAVIKAHRSLWKWLLAPAIISLLLVVAAVLGIVHAVSPVVGWTAMHLPDRLASIASSLLHVVVITLLSAAALLVFTTVAGAIAGPFNELLSERVESVLTGRPPSPFSLVEFVHGALIGAVHAVRRLFAALIGIALVFALGFIPVAGAIVAALVAGWFAATAASYDCYDAVFGRRAMRYRDKLAYLAHDRARTLGLGIAVTGMLLVPGLNLLALGIGSAGATVAACEPRDAARR
jgi:CysZ protein